MYQKIKLSYLGNVSEGKNMLRKMYTTQPKYELVKEKLKFGQRMVGQMGEKLLKLKNTETT